jgi:hypothetical protein
MARRERNDLIAPAEKKRACADDERRQSIILALRPAAFDRHVSGHAVAALPSSDKRLDNADKAERLLRNLARRLDQEAPGVATSILEGLDEMLTVIRLGLPVKLKRLIGKMP